MARDSQLWDADELRGLAVTLDDLECDVPFGGDCFVADLTLAYHDLTTADDVDVTVTRRECDDRLGVQLVGW